MFRRVTLVVVLLVSLPAMATAGAPLAPSAETAVRERAVENVASDPLGADDADTVGGSNEAGEAAALDATAAADANASADATIVRAIELHLTPAEPGTYEAVVGYEIPESVTELKVTLGSESTVTSANGFEQSASDTWTWTGSTNEPTLRVRVDANQTSGGRRADLGASAPSLSAGAGTPSLSASAGTPSLPERASAGAAVSADEGFVFVDAGQWALVRVPRVGTRWRWSGSGDVGLAKETTVDGPGATGGEMAYMGEVQRYEASGRGEAFTLVVPERAELNETPEAVLGSLTAASERLRVGARSERVLVIAAPDDVDWGVAGLQYGEDDAWVLADSSLSSPNNVWLHEYVHTRQTFTTTESGRWVTEATAEYYAGLLAFEQGHVTYGEFESDLERGQRDRYDDDVLGAPASWSGGADYLKGALAAGAIDLRMREATDRRANLQTVFRELNAYNGSVSNAVFLDAVGAAAGSDVRAYAGDLTRTTATADTWTESEHGEYFGSLPAIFEYRIGETAVTASGVLGDRTLAGDSVTLVRGETLRVDVSVANVGWESGTYATGFTVDGTVVANRSGELAANASTTETFERTFDATGTHTVAVADRTLRVEVVEPAEPVVESVDAPATVDAGENVTLTVTYRNAARVPGDVTVPFVVDGESLATRTVRVPAESAVTRKYALSFGTPGEHVVRVGETTVTVTVSGDATTGASTATSADDTLPGMPVPGFGASVAALALVLLALAGVRRREN